MFRTYCGNIVTCYVYLSLYDYYINLFSTMPVSSFVNLIVNITQRIEIKMSFFNSASYENVYLNYNFNFNYLLFFRSLYFLKTIKITRIPLNYPKIHVN